MGILLGIVAIAAIAFGSWQVHHSWGAPLALAVVVAGLVVTILVPFGSIAAIAGCIWLYHEASTDLVRRMARRKDIDDTSELSARAPDWSGWLWGAAVLVVVGSISSTAVFGLPTDRLDDGPMLAGFAGDEVEHAVPDALTEDPGDFDADDAPGADDIEGYPSSGTDGYLFVDARQGQIPVAVQQHAYEPLVEAVVGDDQHALNNLIDADDVVLVEGHAPIEVVDTAGPASQIQITDGPDEGATGWVPFRWTHETPRR